MIEFCLGFLLGSAFSRSGSKAPSGPKWTDVPAVAILDKWQDSIGRFHASIQLKNRKSMIYMYVPGPGVTDVTWEVIEGGMVVVKQFKEGNLVHWEQWMPSVVRY